MKGAAKRLTLSLIVVSALGGCAVYAPPYGYYDNGPYYYGQPVYAAPAYVGPPVFLNFGLQYRSGGSRFHGGGHR